ncbi:MAG: hypothetical protein CMC18_08810 [Flavobacteriaceae bacterium]|nr:hypothetical protein [Flavobacteriaceae bacterium]
MKISTASFILFWLLGSTIFGQSNVEQSKLDASKYIQPAALVDSLTSLGSSWTNENGQEYFFFKRTEFESLASEMKVNLVLGEQSTLKTQELQQALKVVQDSINYLRQEVQAEKDKQFKKILFFGQDVSKSSLTIIAYCLIVLISLIAFYMYYSKKLEKKYIRRIQDGKKQVEVDFEQYKKWALDKEKELTQELFKEKRKKKS